MGGEEQPPESEEAGRPLPEQGAGDEGDAGRGQQQSGLGRSHLENPVAVEEVDRLDRPPADGEAGVAGRQPPEDRVAEHEAEAFAELRAEAGPEPAARLGLGLPDEEDRHG